MGRIRTTTLIRDAFSSSSPIFFSLIYLHNDKKNNIFIFQKKNPEKKNKMKKIKYCVVNKNGGFSYDTVYAMRRAHWL